MKKFTLSVAAVMAMSTFAIAGGDIAPVEEPVVEVVAPVADDSGFYIGLAYSMANYTEEYTQYVENPEEWVMLSLEGEEDYDAIMLQAGYKFNQYLAIEGRYWKSVGDADWSRKGSVDSSGAESVVISENGYTSEYDFTAWGIYLKPMYPVTESFDVYALLGYGNVTLSDANGDWFDKDGFHWGAGASYAFTDNLSLFSDYVQMFNKDAYTTAPLGGWDYTETNSEETIYTINLGVTYKF